jgi:DNA-binding transcriptional LysR family regulator
MSANRLRIPATAKCIPAADAGPVLRGDDSGVFVARERKHMELRRLRYFVAVAEELNFRRAAEVLHVAQPAVSQQVRKLELELGVELFQRSKRAVVLTAPGVVFLDEARRTLRQAEDAAQAARQAGEGTRGRLRIAYPPGPLPLRLCETITRFAVRHPVIQVVPETLRARQAVADVSSGRIDVALVGLPALAPGLAVTVLLQERAVAAVPDRHPLSGQPEMRLDRFSQTPVILLPRHDNPAFHDGVLAALRRAGAAANVIETDESSVDHAMLMVAAGTGIAVLPESATRYGAPATRFLPVGDPELTTEMALLTRADDCAAPVAGLLHIARERTAENLRSVRVPAANVGLTA